jgi:hypothetical protein
MTRIAMTLVCIGTLLSFGSQQAVADTIFEVENARGNARAGGPTNGHAAELLNRWGALSGTPGWRRKYSEFDGSYDEPRPLRRKHYRRAYRD